MAENLRQPSPLFSHRPLDNPAKIRGDVLVMLRQTLDIIEHPFQEVDTINTFHHVPVPNTAIQVIFLHTTQIITNFQLERLAHRLVNNRQKKLKNGFHIGVPTPPQHPFIDEMCGLSQKFLGQLRPLFSHLFFNEIPNLPTEVVATNNITFMGVITKGKLITLD